MRQPTNQELAAVARKAAEIIQQRGKATGATQDGEGRVCTHLALALASVKTECPAAAREPVLSRIRDRVGFKIGKWNDLPTTTEAVIAKVFLQVADDIEVAP